MKIAIIHYWLINMRGGEKMLEALLELFPEADIYTHVYDPSSVSQLINSHKVYTSKIQKFPFAKKLYRKYLPLMPKALMELNLLDYDLIISSEAGPVKGIVANPDAYHICYCHSPMRYLWDMYHEYYKKAGLITKFFMKKFVPTLRLWDVTSANLVDRFITNSNYSARRIKRYYGRDAEVVFGPASIEKYLEMPRQTEDYYLLAGQITEYKRVDVAIEACIKLNRKLIVAGAGLNKKDIRRYAQAALAASAKISASTATEGSPKKTGLIEFKGRVTDQELCSLYSGAKALLFPGIEDMGLIPIEANAAGCPVIAYGKGGVADTIKENVTGLFFDEQSVESMTDAILRFESIESNFSDRAVFTNHVQQFSKEAFKERVSKIINERKRI